MDDHLKRFMVASSFLTGWPADAGEERDYTPILPYFAVVGAFLGIVSWLLTYVCLHSLKESSQAALGAVLVTAGWAYLTRGQNLQSAPGLVERLRGLLSASKEAPEPLAPNLLFFGLIILKLVGVGVLLYNKDFNWLVMVPLMSAFFSVEAGIELEVLPLRASKDMQHRYIMRIAILLFALICGPKGVFTALFVLMLLLVMRDWVRRNFSNDAELWINGGAELLEVIVLWLGVILLS